jgi:hypothetical protein
LSSLPCRLNEFDRSSAKFGKSGILCLALPVAEIDLLDHNRNFENGEGP